MIAAPRDIARSLHNKTAPPRDVRMIALFPLYGPQNIKKGRQEAFPLDGGAVVT